MHRLIALVLATQSTACVAMMAQQVRDVGTEKEVIAGPVREEWVRKGGLQVRDVRLSDGRLTGALVQADTCHVTRRDSEVTTTYYVTDYGGKSVYAYPAVEFLIGAAAGGLAVGCFTRHPDCGVNPDTGEDLPIDDKALGVVYGVMSAGFVLGALADIISILTTKSGKRESVRHIDVSLGKQPCTGGVPVANETGSLAVNTQEHHFVTDDMGRFDVRAGPFERAFLYLESGRSVWVAP